jgi:cation efflux family protein
MAGMLAIMNATSAVHCTTCFPLNTAITAIDDVGERRQANRAIAMSAVRLALTRLIELAIALVSGSVTLFGDTVHNLSDVSTSALVFFGFRTSRKIASKRHPSGYERAEDLTGIGVALVIWASAIVATVEGITKLLDHGTTADLGWGIAAAAVDIAGQPACGVLQPQKPPPPPCRASTPHTPEPAGPDAPYASRSNNQMPNWPRQRARILHFDSRLLRPHPRPGALTTQPTPEMTTDAAPLRGPQHR